MGGLQTRIVAGVIAALVGFIAAIAAMVFLCLGLFYWLSSYMEPGWAAFASAIIILVAAALVIVSARMITRAPRRPAPQPTAQMAAGNARPAGGADGDWTMQMGMMLGQQATDFAKKNPTATVVGALALGLAIGVSPGLREAIRKALFR